jgi:hypothetical protein
MNFKSQVLIQPAYESVSITEPGYEKTIYPSIFQNTFIDNNKPIIELSNVEINYDFQCFKLKSQLRDKNFDNMGLYVADDTQETSIEDFFEIIERPDENNSNREWLFNGNTEITQYPYLLFSSLNDLTNDQSFQISLEKGDILADADQNASIFILLSGIKPYGRNLNDTKNLNALVIQFPLFKKEDIKYGLCNKFDFMYSEKNYSDDNPVQFLNNNNGIVDISEVCDNVKQCNVNKDALTGWIENRLTNTLTFNRIGEELIITSNIFPEDKIIITTSNNFEMNTMILHLYQNTPCPIWFAWSDIVYNTSGTINFKIPLGYKSTVGSSQIQIIYDKIKVLNDTYTSIATDNFYVDGLYCYGKLLFSSSNEKYSPQCNYFTIKIPIVYTKVCNSSIPIDYSNRTLSWSISRNLNQAPTATVVLNNSDLIYSYDDLINLIGQNIIIKNGESNIDQFGRDIVNYKRRFTGIITDIIFNRENPSSSRISLECKGMTSKLDTDAYINRMYDAMNHQDVIKDICLNCRIPVIINDRNTPDEFDKLGVGLQEPKYRIKPGDSWRAMINKMVEFSGWVMDEDEFGNAIYASRYWRTVGFDDPRITQPDEYILPEYTPAESWGIDMITTNIFGNFDTTDNISNFTLNQDSDNLRNIIVVIGQADKNIDASENSLYPAYEKGDPITSIVKNYELYNKMKYEKPLVVIRPEFAIPEQCLFVANRLLKILSEMQKTISFPSLGDNTIYPTTIGVLNDSSFGIINKYIYITSVNENFNDGEYLLNITANVTDSNPVL